MTSTEAIQDITDVIDAINKAQQSWSMGAISETQFFAIRLALFNQINPYVKAAQDVIGATVEELMKSK